MGYGYYDAPTSLRSLTPREELEARIASAQDVANAERRFARLRPTAQNPWLGAEALLTGAKAALAEYDECQATAEFEKLLLTYEVACGKRQSAEALQQKMVEIQTEKNGLHLVRKNSDGSLRRVSAWDLIMRGAHTRTGEPTSADDREERQLAKRFRQLQSDEEFVSGAIAGDAGRVTDLEAKYPFLIQYGKQLEAQEVAA